jgi:hypothetical protein
VTRHAWSQNDADKENAMTRLRKVKAAIGHSAVLAAGSAWADGSPFVGSWHWNRAQSTMPPGAPIPDDLTTEISRIDGSHLKWSVTMLSSGQPPQVETFDLAPNGEFYPISSDTMASFRLTGNTLQATFRGANGESDALTCALSADQKQMTCKGVLTETDGRAANYVDVFDRK